jgi:hypothetical protein
MKSGPENNDSAALDVCLRLRGSPGYASYDAAIAALRRRCRGLSAADADQLIRNAEAVFDAALAFMAERTEHLLAIFQETRAVCPEDVQPFESQFRIECPTASPLLARRALWSAALHHLR